MSNFKLVKFDFDDFEGARIFEEGGLGSWEDYIQDAKEFKYPHECYHGNDYMQFDDFASFEQCFVVSDISRTEAYQIQKLGLDFGTFPHY